MNVIERSISSWHHFNAHLLKMNKSVQHWRTTWKERQRLFEKGYSDAINYINNKPFELCKYPINTWMYSCWNRGFNKALLDNGKL